MGAYGDEYIALTDDTAPETVSTVTDRGGYNESAFGIELKDVHSGLLIEQDGSKMKLKKDTTQEQNATD